MGVDSQIFFGLETITNRVARVLPTFTLPKLISGGAILNRPIGVGVAADVAVGVGVSVAVGSIVAVGLVVVTGRRTYRCLTSLRPASRISTSVRTR